MRVALFASGGEIAVHALRALQREGTVVAVIRPGPSPGWRSDLRALGRRILRPASARPDELSRLAAALEIPEWRARGRSDRAIGDRMRAAAVDLACIATFPWPLAADLIAAPRLGSVNMHASLLPRHRGPNPWFWTYHSDDREAGVTVHVCEPRADRGPILAHSRWALPRGHSIMLLHEEVAERGAALLPGVLARLAAGDVAGEPQDEHTASKAPRVTPGTPMRDPTWSAERTWHFLAGLMGQYLEPLRCADRAVNYTRVSGFEQVGSPDDRGTPGRVEEDRASGGWRLWCSDGFVRLDGERP